MAWFDDTLKTPETSQPVVKEEVFESMTLTPNQIQQISGQFGFEVSKGKDGDYMVVPGNFGSNSDNTQQFIDYWVSGSSIEKQSVEQKRKVRNSTYALMDEIFGISILTLNAYADEALGIGFIEQPIDIQISDKEIETKVNEILARNNIIKRARSQIRSLVKWGDLGAQILIPKDSTDPLDIKIKMVTPDKWEAFFIEQSPVPLGYNLNPSYGAQHTIKKEDLFQPWEFIQFTVPDDEFAPYGRSLLEAMRTAFDQLATIEALLALSRASRVERLIIKIPTNQTNPSAALAKLNQIKSSWKNIIFNDNKSGKKSHARTPSLQDTMFFPSDEGFSIERLPTGSGVELSSTEDVEFFRDNVLMMSGLPKGYLLADESTDRYHALTAQDLKFARQLIPYQDAYATGMTKLCMVLAGYLGADLSTIDITVKIKRPIQMSDQLLQNNEAISRVAIEMIDNYKKANTTLDEEGNEKVPATPKDMYPKILTALGMAEDIISIFTDSTSDDPDYPSLPNPDDDHTSTSTNHDHGVLLDLLEKRKYAVVVNSKGVYKAEKKLFDFFRSGSTIGTNLLIETLGNKNQRNFITSDRKWMTLND